MSLFFLVLLQTEKAGASPSLVPKTILSNPYFTNGIIAQDNVGECACGPCAIFNAFQFGDASLNRLASALPGDASADKVRALIAMYGGRPSVISRDEPRYLAHDGMWDEDLVPFINDWLGENHDQPIKGERLTLQRNETAAAHLRRVYNDLSHSLAAGFPPVVNLQSYVERQNIFHHYWKWMDGHFVTVVAVQPALPQDASKFSMWVADSQTGRVLEVAVDADVGHSPATIAEGRAKRSGKEGTADMMKKDPYLVIQSPKLETILEGPRAQSEKTICVLQYMAHR